MAKKGKNIERFLRKRWLGEHQVELLFYQPWSYTVKDVLVQSRIIKVVYIHHNHAPEQLIRAKLNQMLQYIGDYRLEFTQITPFELAISKLKNKLRGTHRYHNHDYEIVTVNTCLREDIVRNHEGRGVTPERFAVNVVFKMMDWRGDRDFLYVHIEKQVREILNQAEPRLNDGFRVSVRMLKR